MSITHRCQWCDGDYACDTTQEVSEDVYRCQCKAVDSCPGCSEHGACEKCGTAPATGDGHQPFYCGPCGEAWLDNYEPPDEDYDGGVSIAELSERAYRERAEGRD
jgi:hypothetical protein